MTEPISKRLARETGRELGQSLSDFVWGNKVARGKPDLKPKAPPAEPKTVQSSSGMGFWVTAAFLLALFAGHDLTALGILGLYELSILNDKVSKLG